MRPVIAKSEHKMFVYICKQKINIQNILKMTKATFMKFYEGVSLAEGNIIWNFQVDIIFNYQEIVNILFFVYKHNQ